MTRMIFSWTVGAAGSARPFGRSNPILSCTRSLLDAGGYRRELVQSEDYEINVRFTNQGFKPAVLREFLTLRRCRPDSLSGDPLVRWSWGLKAVRLFSRELPEKYRRELAEAAYRFGCFSMQTPGGARLAKEAFAFSKQLGNPLLEGQRLWYRLVVKALGPLCAERLRGGYHRWMFPSVKQMLKRER